jgi:hypothetical protein
MNEILGGIESGLEGEHILFVSMVKFFPNIFAVFLSLRTKFMIRDSDDNLEPNLILLLSM